MFFYNFSLRLDVAYNVDFYLLARMCTYLSLNDNLAWMNKKAQIFFIRRWRVTAIWESRMYSACG